MKLLAAIPLILALAPLAPSESLDDIMARMDRDAKEFKSLSAKIKQVEYTAVIDDSTSRTGDYFLKHNGGISLIVQFHQPDESVVHIDKSKVEIFHPKAKSVDIYDTTKYSGSVEQFLLIGFGTSGADLRKSFNLKLGGAETIDGMATTRIEMTPKTKDFQEYVTRIDLWIPEGKSHPVQQKFFQPSKNYMQNNYSDLKINSNLPDSAFELKLPSGTKKNYPQK